MSFCITHSFRTPRVKPEAQEFADKNRGSLQLFGSGTPRPIAQTPRPEPKCPSSEGMRNYEIGRHGTVSNLLNGSATPRADPAPAPRMRPEAMGYAEAHNGKSTSSLPLPSFDAIASASGFTLGAALADDGNFLGSCRRHFILLPL
jgi:hypothetical protein